jgi:hypothetical protein
MEPHYDPRPQQESFGQMAGRSLGQGVGQGLTAGINRALEDMYEEKAYQKQAMRQQEQNREQLKGLAPILEQLGIPKKSVSQLIQQGLDPNTVLQYAKQNNEAAKIQQEQDYARQFHQNLNQPRQPILNEFEDKLENDISPQNQPEIQPQNEEIQNEKRLPKGQIPAQTKTFSPPDISRFDKVLNKPIAYMKITDMQKAEDRKQREIENLRDREEKKSQKFADEITGIRSKAIERQNANESIRNALSTGDIDKLDGNWFAQVFNLPHLTNKGGAQLLTAVKEHLISDLGSITGPKNQYLERLVNGMNVQVGRGIPENLSVSRMIDSEGDLLDKKVEIYDQLEDYYNNTIGFRPGNIEKEVEERLKPYNAFRQEVLAYELADINDHSIPDQELLQLKKVTPGTPITQRRMDAIMERTTSEEWPDGNPNEAYKIAKAMGYAIPSDEVINTAKPVPEILKRKK